MLHTQLPPRNELPPRRWPWWVAGVAVMLVITLLTVWLLTRPSDDDPQVAPTETISTPPPSPTDSTGVDSTEDAPSEDPPPTGCLGGVGLDAAMFLQAQEEAPHSANGAVEVMTAMVRWMRQYPYPSEDDIETMQRQAVSSTSDVDLTEAFSDNPQIAEDAVPAGEPVNIYTVGGAWYLDSYTEERAVVTIGYRWLTDSRVAGEYGASTTFVMVWEDGAWRVQSAQQPEYSPNEIVNEVGTPFTGGC